MVVTISIVTGLLDFSSLGSVDRFIEKLQVFSGDRVQQIQDIFEVIISVHIHLQAKSPSSNIGLTHVVQQLKDFVEQDERTYTFVVGVDGCVVEDVLGVADLVGDGGRLVPRHGARRAVHPVDALEQLVERLPDVIDHLQRLQNHVHRFEWERVVAAPSRK